MRIREIRGGAQYRTVRYGTIPYAYEIVQFSVCGTESQGDTYWVRGYAARELRFSVLTVPVKREVVSLTTTGPFTVCGSFSFARTELLSSSLWRRLLCENRNGFLRIKYSVLTDIYVLIT